MEERFLNLRNCAALVCAVVIGFLVLGTNKLAAQLFIACMDFYDAGRKDASLPFTLVFIMRSLSGPLTGYLGRKYGSLTVTGYGSLFCIVGVGGCFFAKNMATVSFLWGVVYGLGTGLGSLLIPHILRDFFIKHYDKAQGYYVAGSGIGGFLLPLLADGLLSQYGVQGTFLIFSGIMSNLIVAWLVLRSLKRGHQNSVLVATTRELQTDKSSASKLKATGLELADISTNVNKGVTINAKTDLAVDTHKSEFNSNTDFIKVNVPKSALSSEVKNNNNEPEHPRTRELSENIILEMFHIFVEPSFVIIQISQCLLLFVIHTFYTTVIDFARDVGVSLDVEVYTLMIVAVSDVVGRIVFGYVTDGGYLSHLNFYVLSFVLLGILLCILTIVNSFLVLMITLCFVGLMFGGLTMISVGLMYTFLDKDDMIIALPCRFFLYPLLGFSKSFLIEIFREGYGSYNGLMFTMSLMCVFSALLSLLLPAARRFRENSEKY